MKATISGIIYEGTPEEISAMMLIQQAHNRNKPFKQPDGCIDLFPHLKRSTTGQAPAYLGEYTVYNGQ